MKYTVHDPADVRNHGNFSLSKRRSNPDDGSIVIVTISVLIQPNNNFSEYFGIDC